MPRLAHWYQAMENKLWCQLSWKNNKTTWNLERKPRCSAEKMMQGLWLMLHNLMLGIFVHKLLLSCHWENMKKATSIVLMPTWKARKRAEKELFIINHHCNVQQSFSVSLLWHSQKMRMTCTGHLFPSWFFSYSFIREASNTEYLVFTLLSIQQVSSFPGNKRVAGLVGAGEYI